jgi:hypothetical protein
MKMPFLKKQQAFNLQGSFSNYAFWAFKACSKCTYVLPNYNI